MVWAELAAAYRNDVEQERQVRGGAVARARDAKARHERNAPERPTGFAARFKEAAYDEQLQTFLRETGRFNVEIREAEKQLATFENRVRQTNVMLRRSSSILQSSSSARESDTSSVRLVRSIGIIGYASAATSNCTGCGHFKMYQPVQSDLSRDGTSTLVFWPSVVGR